MKIFILAYWHDPRFKRKVGGLIRIFELADNLTSLGHSVILFLPKIGYPKKQTVAKVIEIPFVDFALIRPLSFHFISSLMLFTRLMERVDLLYVRQMNSFLPMLIARLFKVPVFFEIPNDPYLAYRSSGKIRRFLEKTIDNYSMVLADKIVVLSEWSKRRLNQIGRGSLSKIIVLPSGTDTKLFRPLTKKESCSKLGLDPSFFYIGFVGSFSIHQGVNILIDSAPIILEKSANARFLLVGDGPMMDTWKKKVNEKDLQDAFLFTGHVPYKEVPEYICSMDICVAPHRKDSNQASPVKLFDYMACARAIVASDTEVVREIAAGSGCALLFKPESASDLSSGIISLLQNPRRRKEMGREARELATNRYDRRKIFQRLESIVLRY